MYTGLLTIHSYLRWVVLILALVVIARALAGIVGHRAWQSADNSIVRWLTTTLDAQMLIGLVIYFFLSPFTMSAWNDIGATMRDDGVRLIVVEHQVGMLIALALAHIGRARIRKASSDAQRHRTALIFFGLALVIMLVSIPWPGRPGGRALFRGIE